MIVKGARHHFLTGTGFARHKHCDVTLRKPPDCPKDFLHGSGLSDDFGHRLPCLSLWRLRGPRLFAGPAQKFNRAVDVKGLGEVLVRSALKGVHRTVQVTESRHDDDRHFRMLFFDGVKELHAGRPLHTDIT